MRPQTIGLVAHTGKPGAAELVRAVCHEFERRSLPVLVEAETARLVGNDSGYSVSDLGRQTDLVVVLVATETIRTRLAAPHGRTRSRRCSASHGFSA
jgi:hypothetical protein